jgi:hypothetical protein
MIDILKNKQVEGAIYWRYDFVMPEYRSAQWLYRQHLSARYRPAAGQHGSCPRFTNDPVTFTGESYITLVPQLGRSA